MTIATNLSNAVSTYSVSVSPTADGGETVPIMALGSTVNVQLPSTGSTVQWRFILDSKMPFSVSASVSSGQLNMYVSLDPGSSQKAIWQTSGSSSNPISINVDTIDPNFHHGAYYYIIM